MSDTMHEPASPATDPVEALNARAENLERQLQQVMEMTRERLVQAELKAEAVRQGMVDLDGLKLIDRASLKVSDSGEVEAAGAAIQDLKRRKPWLFLRSNSSSPASAPSPTPPRAKLATEMTHQEWQAARAELLRRR